MTSELLIWLTFNWEIYFSFKIIWNLPMTPKAETVLLNPDPIFWPTFDRLPSSIIIWKTIQSKLWKWWLYIYRSPILIKLNPYLWMQVNFSKGTYFVEWLPGVLLFLWPNRRFCRRKWWALGVRSDPVSRPGTWSRCCSTLPSSTSKSKNNKQT